MKKRNPIIALAQIKYFDTPEKHNVEKIKKYIQLAKKKGAAIICFPETCVHKTDYLSLDHSLIKEIRNSCKKNSIWAIITDTFSMNKKQYKVALLMDREGKIRGKYKKINLYDDEAIAGKKIFVYKTDFAKIGIAICWDLVNQEIFQRMKKAGAEIIFCPSQWCYEVHAYGARKYETKHWEKEKAVLKSLIMARAFENLFFVALCSPAKRTKDLISYSAIYSPHKILSEITNKEGLIIGKINLKEIPKLSKLYAKESHL